MKPSTGEPPDASLPPVIPDAVAECVMSVGDVVALAYRAAKYLVGFRYDPRRGLAIIEPAQAEVAFVGATPRGNQILLAMVCAVTAECYRELADVTTAAAWYRRAAGHCKEGPGYPSIYADMVITHRLTDHYALALECLRLARALWLSRPLPVHLYHSIITGWWRHPSHWLLRLRERTLLPRLEALVREQAAVGSGGAPPAAP